MKKRIFIMLLIFTLLLGAFSINAFASEGEIEYRFTSCDFRDDAPSIIYNSGLLYQSKIYFNFVSNGTEFDFLYVNKIVTNMAFQYGIDGKPTGTDVTMYSDNVYVGLKEEYRSIHSVGDYVVISEDLYNLLNSVSDNFVGEIVEPHTHSYTSSIIAPSCIEKGYTSYICECGDTYTDTEVSALGHSYSSVVTNATCTQPGFTTHNCTVCGDTYTDSESSVLPHSYDSVVTESTCTENGFITYTCSACGDSYTGEKLDLISHNYVSVVTPPTVSKKGFTTHICSMCSDTFVDSWVDEIPSSEDSILTVWDGIFTDFIALFGPAQSIFFDGSSLTLIGGLSVLGLALGLGFLLLLLLEKFLRF